jgi:hypothetical protein
MKIRKKRAATLKRVRELERLEAAIEKQLDNKKKEEFIKRKEELGTVDIREDSNYGI